MDSVGKGLKKYSIQFIGLVEGKHLFEYYIDESFFANFEYSPIRDSKIKVYLCFDKKENHLVLDFELKGTVNVQCGRCMEYFDYPLDNKNKMMIKLSSEEIENTDEMITLDAEAIEFNVAQLIYEFINLALPLNLVHSENEKGESGCNPEIEEKLKEINVDHTEDNKNTDPRWDALKSLIKEN